MKHLLPVFATLIAGTSTLFAQPGSPEEPVTAEPVTPPVPVAPVIAAQPPPTQLATPAPIEAVTTGFALEVRVETGLMEISNNYTVPAMAAGFFLGYRSRPFTVGVGFDFSRRSQTQSPATADSETSATSILAMPGIRFVLARTGDARTELLGQVDVGYGVTIRSGANGADFPNQNRARAQVGPSLRHWVTPSFAIGGTAGIRYEVSKVTIDFGSGRTSESSTSISGLFASLQMTGVF